MIILIGIGHIFKLRERLKEEIHRAQPGVVCIELDAARMALLLQSHGQELKGVRVARFPEPPAPGMRALMVRLFGSLLLNMLVLMQGRLARAYGSTAGDEMVAAWEAAQEVGAKAQLIDADSAVFFRRWISSLSAGEWARLLLATAAGVFASRKRVEKELEQFYEDEDAFVREIAEQFPDTKRELIDNRNLHMARGIHAAQQQAEVVVAVVGEGHLAGIRAELVKAGQSADAIRTITLKDLQEPPRASGPPVTPGATNAEVSMSFVAHGEDTPGRGAPRE